MKTVVQLCAAVQWGFLVLSSCVLIAGSLAVQYQW